MGLIDSGNAVIIIKKNKGWYRAYALLSTILFLFLGDDDFV